MDIVREWAEESNIQAGYTDANLMNTYAKVRFAPMGYDALAILFPSGYRAPVCGASVFGATDKPLVLQCINGTEITFPNAALTKLAGVSLGADKDLLGEIEFTCLLADGADVDDADSLYELDTGTFSATNLATAKSIRTKYNAVWGTNTGFTAFDDYDGWQIACDLKLSSPIAPQGLWRDFKVEGFSATASCKPVGPTYQNIKDAMAIETALVGSRASVGAADLVITGVGSGAPVITVKGAYINSGASHTFGNAWGLGALTWKSTGSVTAGVPSAHLILA